ncbi:unnamed protein product, partial [Mesorhabditis spiculigera]
MRPLIVLISLAFVSPISADCLQGWVEIPEENTCILMSKMDLAHLQALRNCQTLGASLVKIGDAFMNTAIAIEAMTFENGRKTLIGIEKMSSGEWAYSDGTQLQYSKWKSGEPKANASCAAIDPTTAFWETVDCGVKMPYVCGKQDKNAPCDLGWSYSEESNACYWLKASP